MRERENICVCTQEHVGGGSEGKGEGGGKNSKQTSC